MKSVGEGRSFLASLSGSIFPPFGWYPETLRRLHSPPSFPFQMNRDRRKNECSVSTQLAKWMALPRTQNFKEEARNITR